MNEITWENIELHTKEQIQNENVKNGLARCDNELKEKSIEKWRKNYIKQQLTLQETNLINTFKEWYFKEYNYKISNDDTLENLVEYIRKFMDSMTTDNDILKTCFDYNSYVMGLISDDNYEVYRLVSNNRFLKYKESFHDISYEGYDDNFNSNHIIYNEKCIIFKKVEARVKIKSLEDEIASLKAHNEVLQKKLDTIRSAL
jgi:hypothetical protein